MSGVQRVAKSLVGALRSALVAGAVPGETEGFTAQSQEAAAAFVARAALERSPARPKIALESTGGPAGQRRMRLAVINDDMPFLVDSIAAVLAAHGLTIHRLLHPVVSARRTEQGRLRSLGDGAAESIVYVELDRCGARERRAIVAQLDRALADVRLAVADWEKMRARMLVDAGAIAELDAEAAHLLEWLADHHFTLLGHADVGLDARVEAGLGILAADQALWPEPAAADLLARAAAQRKPLMLLKADRLSTVHRRVPLDVVIVRNADGALSIHVGLWTSAALRASPTEVPVLRQRLEELDRDLGVAPSGHAAKALLHAVSTLPHDLLTSLEETEVRHAALTAVSLADRPRPKLILLPGNLGGHLHALVWLAREELSTERRQAIMRLLEQAAGAPVISWASETGDGELSFLRFTLPLHGRPVPDERQLDAAVVGLLRGWAPAVEAELAASVGSARGARLAISLIAAMPESYRVRTTPADAAADVLRLALLRGERRRCVRMVSTGQQHRLRLKLYQRGELVPLSEAVPVLENFGFVVIEEIPSTIGGADPRHIHDFLVELKAGEPAAMLKRAAVIEEAITAVLDGTAENDAFNQLIVTAGIEPQPVVWLRAWFRYLRQIGVPYGLDTSAAALRRAPGATAALIELFRAAHDPAAESGRQGRIARSGARLDDALRSVAALDDDRILRRFRSLVEAVLRTNAFACPAGAALAFKINSARVPGLPAPVPWREIWVYSPRVEGVHLRGGPIARGGLRWSDRRDDFRTEILGLMKAQLVKNAVIVPTGAKGGFYAKHLPDPSRRDAWLAEGTECYRIFIRSLLSVTDNIVADRVVHPHGIVIGDGDDPYFVVAADKGTAAFSDVANAIALEHGFWLGDAFASGGSNGYDHKAMGITARGAWLSVRRHFLEMGIDVQLQPVRVVGCGDMSGDVFGNGMLLSRSIKLVAAFDHRHIFIDPDPDPEASWQERRRLFRLPRSSWDDYNRELLSAGGGIYARSEKSIRLSKEARAALGIDAAAVDPSALIAALLKSPADLLWFGGIGTYVKASTQSHADVGDPQNDGLRVDAAELRARVIGEGANLAVTQAARIEFAMLGGRINTDFIDNSGGVDCSDNEVNIKIALNRDLAAGKLGEEQRRRLLARMTEDVAELVLEDNRLQALALSVAEAGGAAALPNLVRSIELLEASGRLDRKVEGLEPSQALLRRAQEDRGLTRPELAVILSLSKIALKAAAEKLRLSTEPMLEPQLFAAFPQPMRRPHAEAIRAHRLRDEILATKVANRLVNRLGPSMALELTEEEGVSLGQLVAAFLVAEQLLDLPALWQSIDAAPVAEPARIELLQLTADTIRVHLADIVRAARGETGVGTLVELFTPGMEQINPATARLIRAEVKAEAAARRARLESLGASDSIRDRLVRLYETDGIFALAALASRKKVDAVALTRSYTRLGETLGLDWAQGQLSRYRPTDRWERLLAAGIARDLEQIRIDFLARAGSGDPAKWIDRWIERRGPDIDRFRRTIAASRASSRMTIAMLAQITSEARALLAR